MTLLFESPFQFPLIDPVLTCTYMFTCWLVTLFSGSIQDYVLLEKLNKLTVTKYSEMSDTAKTLITVMEELDKKCKDLYEMDRMAIWKFCDWLRGERILGSLPSFKP